MARERAETRSHGPANAGSGPYRAFPSADPTARARLFSALCDARIEARRLKRAERWLLGLAAGGFIATAVVVNPPPRDGSGGLKEIVWVPMAAGATYALVRAGRVESRMRDLEMEIAGIERLATMLARASGQRSCMIEAG